MIKFLMVVPLILLLSGCAGFIRSDIAVFHDLPPDFAGTTYASIPFKEQGGSLEHKTYDQLVKQELNAKGFKEEPIDKAEVVVFISYGIDTGREVVSSYPIFGQTGVSSIYTTGTVQSYGSYGTYSGTTTYTPTYGIVGAVPMSQTQYTRFLKIEILDKKALVQQNIKKIYEAKVLSRGSSVQLSKVMPSMIKALFEDFPGKSGSTRSSTRSLK
jgi:hypothetical protein